MRLRGSRRWPKCLGPCYPYGRWNGTPGSSGLAQPQLLWASGEWTGRWKISLSVSCCLFPLCAFQINKEIFKRVKCEVKFCIAVSTESHSACCETSAFHNLASVNFPNLTSCLSVNPGLSPPTASHAHTPHLFISPHLLNYLICQMKMAYH